MDDFVGRARELTRCGELLDATLLGRGQLVVFAGEPGIGKTVLAGRVALGAVERGCRVAWGRCWEAGGAPPYWPWSQVFRALETEDPFAEADDVSLDARDVRFRRFDVARQELGRVARDAPLAIILDDLHTADLPSLSFLHFVAQALHSMRILIVGTYRDAEARLAGDAATLLSKVGREGEVFTLGRLERDEVVGWVLRAAPGTSEAVAREIHTLSEGNPLFVREVLRIGGSLDARRLPDTLRATVAEHMGRLSPEARALLGKGAVLGREMNARDLARVAGIEADTVESLLRKSTDAGIIEPIRAEPERYAFTHVLLRDTLYAELSPSERAALHWRAGSHWVSERADFSTAAHHMLEARAVAPVAEVVTVVRDAARVAMARLAFEDAASLAARGLEVLGPRPEAMPSYVELACELEILRAEALIRSGDAARGRQSCVYAASLAERIDSAALQARAALAYGTELTASVVDPTMVRLLRKALDALSIVRSDTAASHGALRARVMARLAVALTPPQTDADLDSIDALAREALALAKSLGDPETLLFVAYFVSNATAGAGYQMSPNERHATLSVVMDLATELDRSVVLVNAAPRWITSLCECASRTDALTALEAYAERVRELPRPYYQWRVPMVRATLALLDGKLADAERLGREGLAIAEAGGVAVGAVGWATHRLALAQASGDLASLAPVAGRVLAALAPLPAIASFGSWLLAATGRTEEARERLATEKHERFSAPSLIASGDAAVLLGDRELAARILPVLEEHRREAAVFWGSPHGCAAYGPVPRVLGDLAALLGRTGDAARFYEETLTIGERMGAALFIAQAERRLKELGRPSRSRNPRGAPRAHEIRLVREGDVWTVSSFTGVTVRLEDAKGLHYLERLVREPEREIHVTELAGLEERAGDLGPLLDARAKSTYKERVGSLEDELEEAQRFADPARAERARAEIDAIMSELARATGLGARDRRAGSLTERARINVQRRIRHTLRQIEKQDPVLARYLDAAVRTGPFCAYKPV